MAAQGVEEQAAYAPSPDVVGNAFARQYYQILEQSPELVYRFYQDLSKLGRPDNTGIMGSTTTMDAINEKIQSYGSLKAEVKFVDAQESYNEGVIVLVIGSMIQADGSRRGFTQTFFLAPQDKGYYVLNDMFRYLEEDINHSVKQDNDVAPTAPIQETSVALENHISEQSNEEVYDPPNGEVPVEEEVEEEEEPVAEVVDEAPSESQVLVEPNVKAEEVPKKSYASMSYASIVKKDAPASTPPSLPKSVTRTQEQPLPKASSLPSVPQPPPSSVDSVDDEINQEHEGDGHSIYIKNLPANITAVVVEENFKRFGPIKHDGIQIRNTKGFYFGFVEFEVANAVRSAIEASPILIAGREVVVEEKRSTASRGNSRGRYPSGRGGGYRGEGGRGRGAYGGGRGGYGRGDTFRNDFGNRGRGFQNRSSNEGYQRSDQAGGTNNNGRGNRGTGPGFGSGRTQRVSA